MIINSPEISNWKMTLEKVMLNQTSLCLFTTKISARHCYKDALGIKYASYIVRATSNTRVISSHLYDLISPLQDRAGNAGMAMVRSFPKD